MSMALYQREKDGEGQEIDLDLLSPIMTAVGPGIIYADQLGIDQDRTGNRSLNNAPSATPTGRETTIGSRSPPARTRSPSG